MSTSSVPEKHPTSRSLLVLFDGDCNLCNGWVSFIVRHDPNKVFQFASQRSSSGEVMIHEHLGDFPRLSSIILIADNSIYTQSTAMLEILARLSPPWSWIALLRIIPHPFRDAVYRFVARHRYHWFGKSDACEVPSADVRSRFVG